MASILVTAGPTHEYVDDVRFYANGSSGRMGYALAEVARAAGHDVVLISGPVQFRPPPDIELREVTSALEMRDAVQAVVDDGIECVFAAAAVSDYRPATRHSGKLPGGRKGFAIQMIPNPDILAELGQRRADGEIDPVLVGFALQSGTPEEILDIGRDKLHQKQIDLIVVNHISAIGALDNEATLVFAGGQEEPLSRRDKKELARDILFAAEGILATRDPRPTGPDQGDEGTSKS